MNFISDITVRLIQQAGGDHMVVAAAKVSTTGEEASEFAKEEASLSNYGLINYLIKHRHGTPFEHGSLTFFVHAPIFVWREWHRHRVGFCLAGDTEIWSESISVNCGRTLRKHRIADLYDRWDNGVKDNLGRIRKLPSVYQQKLRVLNEDTHLFELGGINNVYQSGIKELFLLRTDDLRWNNLRCSADHRVLTSDGWAKICELSGDEYVYVNGKRNSNTIVMPPSLRSGIGVWTSMQRNKLIRSSDKCYLCGKKFDRDELELDHEVPVVMDLLKALDIKNLRPACFECHRKKSNSEQILAERNIVAGSKLAKLIGKPKKVSEEMTYDISMKGPWHNFVANGIVVHNSYNEESGRYKQLEPTFWIPHKDRKFIPVDNFKPARPQFRSGSDEEYEWLVDDFKKGYIDAYNRYEERLKRGIAKEVARAGLPVGIYSSCWVTCNPRSLMAFLSLRTQEKDAKFTSYPQAEIEIAARATEQFLQEGWPLVYKAFCENGRIGP